MTTTLSVLRSIGFACALSFTVQAQDGAASVSGLRAEQTPQQRIEATVRDYVEGIYNAQPERMARCLSSELTKFGFWRPGPDQDYKDMPMSHAELMKLAADYNVDHKRIPEGAPYEIEVLGLLPSVAVVKLTAAWGSDYMNLAKMEGGWKIRQILWQSQRDETPAASSEDKAAVRQAATDYATAFYTCNPALIEAAVHPKLAKFGFYNGQAMPMDFEQLKALCATAYKDRKLSETPKTVELLDCLDQTACVKLSADWGIDFMILHREGKGWKIRQVIWQSHPPKANK